MWFSSGAPSKKPSVFACPSHVGAHLSPGSSPQGDPHDSMRFTVFSHTASFGLITNLQTVSRQCQSNMYLDTFEGLVVFFLYVQVEGMSQSIEASSQLLSGLIYQVFYVLSYLTIGFRIILIRLPKNETTHALLNWTKRRSLE